MKRKSPLFGANVIESHVPHVPFLINFKHGVSSTERTQVFSVFNKAEATGVFGLEVLVQEAEAEFPSSLSSIQEAWFILDIMAFGFDSCIILTKDCSFG
ncbi:ATP-binding protein [Sesbania bispinosa]|nr:ATP-binding protein [Sesbania bispinosa]